MVLAFTTPAIEEEAMLVFAFTAAVPAVILAAREVDAARTVAFVLLLTAV